MGKILIIGSDGMVGSRFVELYSNNEGLLTPTIAEFDLLKPRLIEKYIKDHAVSSVINFAAFTDVGEAEKDRGNKNGMCWNINIDGIKNLLDIVSTDIHLVHISTDMVFSGRKENKGPYKESDLPEKNQNKVTWYGYTKGVGENIIREGNKTSTIVRIMYPVRAKYDKKLDYLRKPLKLYNEGILYPVFFDQQISITFIDELCETVSKILTDKITGVYHCASDNTTSPYEIISYLIEAKYGVKNAVKCESINNYLSTSNTSLRYPIYGGLSCKISQNILGMKYSSWKQVVDKLIVQGISP